MVLNKDLREFVELLNEKAGRPQDKVDAKKLKERKSKKK